MKPNRLVLAVVLACAIGAPLMAYQTAKIGGVDAFYAQAAPTLPRAGEIPPFTGATTWLNSPPLTPAELRGKVVLVDFWTYSCINWLRTLPHLRAWAAKYKDHGVVVVGVHSPEFEFEKNLDNIRLAARDMKVDYPIAVDSDHAIWRAFHNQYWPALYIVDTKGRIRHRQFGEGGFEQSERIVQELLADAGRSGIPRDLVTVDAQGAEVAADFSDVKSPETYLGLDRAANFVSQGGAARDKARVYSTPARLRLNTWALSGDWTVGNEFATLNKPDGRIAYRFHARDLHIVMGPAARGTAVRFRVLIDGVAPRGDHGVDVDEQGNGVVKEQRLYQLIRQHKPIADKQFEIEFLDPGVQAYVFTFG